MNSARHETSDWVKQIAALLKRGSFVEAEQACMNILRRTRIVPQAWVFLGEALLRQGYKHASGSAFKRALLLDPTASWEEAVQSELARLAEDEPRSDIVDLLAVKKVSVCAGLIIKDEERSIQRCLDSIMDAVDEVVVVDTGSTDGTLDIVRKYSGIKLYHYAWNNDFAAARNEVLKYVTSDWVFYIDADQYLHPDDVTVIREAAGLLDPVRMPTAYIVGEIHTNEHHSLVNYSASKFFPMRHKLRYWGKIHEQVGKQEGLYEDPVHSKPVRIRVYHDGYEPDIISAKQKIQRNIPILKQMVQEDPQNPAILMFLGRDMLAGGHQDEALTVLLEAAAAAATAAWFGRLLDIHMYILKIYLTNNDLEQAEAVCKRALEHNPNFPDAHYWLGVIHLTKAKRRFHSAARHFLQAKRGFDTYRGTVTADHRIREGKADQALAALASRMKWNG